MKTFEQKLDQLREINEKLSAMDLPLSEVVDHYKKAQELMNELKEELEQSKLVVESISKSLDII